MVKSLEPMKVIFCYAREDEILLNKLKKQLQGLERQKILQMWHDRDISAGTEWVPEIEKRLDAADIILLLISSDFMASDYCYDVEMMHAMERHKSGEARVIPVILRPVIWQNAPFGKLQALPRDGKPVIEPDWYHESRAFYDIEKGIFTAIEQLHLARSFRDACVSDDDREILAVYSQIQESSDHHTLPFTIEQQQRVKMALQRVALQKLQETLHEGRPQQIIEAFTASSLAINTLSPKERQQITLAQKFINAYQANDHSALLMAYQALVASFYPCVFSQKEKEQIGSAMQKENLLEPRAIKQTGVGGSDHMLKPGQKIPLSVGICEVKEFLGGGRQGEVYKVQVAGKSLALKWYYPSSATESQKKSLEWLISQGAPTSKFLWPLELAFLPNTAEYGYVMPLREPRYNDLVDLMMRRVNFTFRNLATAVLHLADSYYKLHTNGLCYLDLSFGNIFLDATNGEVLICGNDNVTVNGETAGGILGTSRFMAPEIVRGEALPSIVTDRYSLAILFFYMLMSSHPLEGKKEYDIHVLDAAAMTKIYGTEPLFIFDPHDSSNAPVKGYQDYALIFWPIYPQFVRDLFVRAFTNGLHDPQNGRVLAQEWRSAMIRLLDAIVSCQHCNAQNFYDDRKPYLCWNCKKNVQFPLRLYMNDTVIMLNSDTKLYPYHVDRHQEYDSSQPIAAVTQYSPDDPSLLGLKNLSSENWVLTLPDMSTQRVGVNECAALVVGSKISFGQSEGTVMGSE